MGAEKKSKRTNCITGWQAQFLRLAFMQNKENNFKFNLKWKVSHGNNEERCDDKEIGSKKEIKQQPNLTGTKTKFRAIRQDAVLNVSGSENRTIKRFLFSFNAQSFLFVLFTLKGETILGKHIWKVPFH